MLFTCLHILSSAGFERALMIADGIRQMVFLRFENVKGNFGDLLHI